MEMSLSILRTNARVFNPIRRSFCLNRRWNHSDANEVLARYKEKLNKKALEVGVKDIDELKDKFKDDIKETKIKLNKIDPLKELEEYEKKMGEGKKEFKTREPRSPKTPEAPYKTLDSYLEVSKLENLGLKELEYIWRARFASKENSLVAIIPNDVFNKFYYNARKNPSFVLPLPKDDKGEEIEMHYVQWTFAAKNTTHCMITSLVEYKLHKEFARPHTTLAFHSELQKSHKVALMQGNIEKDANITLQEAQLLLLNLQRFYGAMDETEVSKRRLKLLQDFTEGNQDFNLELLVKEATSLEN